jgi:hypothetical protein
MALPGDANKDSLLLKNYCTTNLPFFCLALPGETNKNFLLFLLEKNYCTTLPQILPLYFSGPARQYKQRKTLHFVFLCV